MGGDKAFLRLGNKTLIEIARDLLASACATVSTVGDRSRFGEEAIEDVFRDCGPLAGIHAALSATNSGLNLMIAVDTPFLDPGFLSWMLRIAVESGAMVTVPQLAGGFQPLCAVYHRDFKSIAADALKAKRCKIDALYPTVKTRMITEAELKQLAFDGRMFDNLNTRAEFDRALKEKT